MPTLAEFAGLKICMYREDRSPHHFPHVHAYFAEYDAVIRVPDGELIESDDAFPKSKLRQEAIFDCSKVSPCNRRRLSNRSKVSPCNRRRLSNRSIDPNFRDFSLKTT